MAVEPNRYKGIARNGKIELEIGVNVPDGAEVVVLIGVKGTKNAPIIERARRDRRWLDRLAGL